MPRLVAAVLVCLSVLPDSSLAQASEGGQTVYISTPVRYKNLSYELVSYLKERRYETEINFELVIVDNNSNPADFDKSSIVISDGLGLSKFYFGIDYELSITSVPFKWSSNQELISFQNSEKGISYLGGASSEGLLGLSYLNNGVSILASTKPTTIREMDKGLKVVSYVENSEVWERYGSAVTSSAPDNVVTALIAGAYDTAELSPDYALKIFDESSDIYFSSSYNPQSAIAFINKKNWDKLPFLVRVPVAEGVREFSDSRNEKILKAEAAIEKSSRWISLENPDGNAIATERRIEWLKSQDDKLSDLIDKINYRQNDLEGVQFEKNNRNFSNQRYIYFITNRRKTKSKNPDLLFSDWRTDELTCGEYDRIENEIYWLRSGIDTCRSFLHDLADENAILFIHGFKNSFADAIDAGWAIGSLLKVNRKILVWSWPSRQEVADYVHDKESADDARVRFIESIYPKRRSSDRFDVISHSMGNYLLVGAIDYLNSNGATPFANNVIFAAPDVAKDVFSRAVDKASHLGGKLTMYICDWDLPLITSHQVNRFPRAGLEGPDDAVNRTLIDVIDVRAKLFSFNHSYIYKDKKIISDVELLLSGKQVPTERGLRENGADYRFP